jgi:hypothetical protein
MNRTECLVLCEEKNCEGSKAKERIRVVLLTVSHGGGIEDKKALSSPNEQLPPKSNIDTSPTVSPPTQLRSMEEKERPRARGYLLSVSVATATGPRTRRRLDYFYHQSIHPGGLELLFFS